MITVLVKEIEKETQTLKEENTILKFLLKECVKKSMDYKELLQESLELLDKYQKEVSNLKIRDNLWSDEVAKQYFITEDLDKALRAVGKEIMLYELNKNKGEM
ncbi:hypothetical protein [Clostridium botulinum]|uniref:hypothetical protein n=1 Tax=Clostridium botulinum TaxID=1491 RepID=UPI00059D602B|nr:hypothetical protein [Clostridium botulinum]KIN81886.1 hypothetical protein SD74_08105 [Clostridium botulinum]MCC5425564.1 hypothetical protein [Clostridium botulinum]